MAGSASLLASECPNLTVKSLLMANKVARFLRSTAKVHLTIWPLDLSAITMITCSDAGGPGSAKNNGAQGGWLVFMGEPHVKDSRRAKVSILAWRSITALEAGGIIHPLS